MKKLLTFIIICLTTISLTGCGFVIGEVETVKESSSSSQSEIKLSENFYFNLYTK